MYQVPFSLKNFPVPFPGGTSRSFRTVDGPVMMIERRSFMTSMRCQLLCFSCMKVVVTSEVNDKVRYVMTLFFNLLKERISTNAPLFQPFIFRPLGVFPVAVFLGMYPGWLPFIWPAGPPLYQRFE